MVRRWMHWRERRLTRRDRNRRVFPFEWGLDWLPEVGDGDNPLRAIQKFSSDFLNGSRDFFTPQPLSEYRWEKERLAFQTPLPGLVSNNNLVECRTFEAEGSRRAVIVVPQWNADSESHVTLCKLLQKLGFTVVRQCLPYHEKRRPEGMERADFLVGPNIGRTLHGIRQAVLELRQIVDCLRRRGYQRIGVMGTSIGSCVGYLAFVHEPAIQAAVFNHVSGFFADVVWRGMATRYIRRGLESHITLEDLRRCWGPISPFHYIPTLAGEQRRHLLITAKYDLTFLPELSEQVVDEYRRHRVEFDRVQLPCGHYTMGKFPVSWLDGWHICTYLRRHLG